MQRIILRECRDYVEGKYDLMIREPIEIEVCFADLPSRYSETHKNKRWMMWNDECTRLLDELREEPVRAPLDDIDQTCSRFSNRVKGLPFCAPITCTP